jgi:hypothetical protein
MWLDSGTIPVNLTVSVNEFVAGTIWPVPAAVLAFSAFMVKLMGRGGEAVSLAPPPQAATARTLKAATRTFLTLS